MSICTRHVSLLLREGEYDLFVFFSRKKPCVYVLLFFFSLPPLSLPLFFIFFTLCFSRNRIVLSIFQLLYVHVFFFFFSFHGYRKCCYRWIYCEQTEMESTDASLVFFFSLCWLARLHIVIFGVVVSVLLCRWLNKYVYFVAVLIYLSRVITSRRYQFSRFERTRHDRARMLEKWKTVV